MNHIDLILLDIQLPDGNGISLYVKKLKKSMRCQLFLSCLKWMKKQL